MNLPTHFPPISYRLKESVEMQEREDGVVAISPFFQVTISPLSPELRQVMMTLAKRTCSIRWMNEVIMKAHGESMLVPFYRYLSSLIRHQMMDIYAENEHKEIVLATLMPISPHFQHKWAVVQRDQPYRISRFAYVRRDEDGCNYLESPLSHACMRLDSLAAASLIYQLGKVVTPSELAQTLPEEDRETVVSLLTLLVMGNFVSPTTSEGRLNEDENEAYTHWAFHDLLFHSRSREGRHNNLLGGTFRFPPQPAVKQAQWPVIILLPQPDMDRIRATDPGLTAVMEARTSIRDYGDNPIAIAQLGEFLYRVAHVKEVYSCGERGDFTKRPYPSGGASYAIEFYLTIDRCAGLNPGFYWYDPLHHALAFIQEPNKDTERLLSDASQAIGERSRPQVLITLAARFQRVSWKYRGLAYELILKDVGVIQATMYLVATAMDLAPCALGVGDSDCFTKLSGTDYLKETSVGEFILGSKA